MDDFANLLLDNESTRGRLVTTAAVMVLGVVLAWVAGRLLAQRADDSYGRYYARKISRYVVAALVLLALAVYGVPSPAVSASWLAWPPRAWPSPWRRSSGPWRAGSTS